MEETAERKPIHFQYFYCNSCNGLLFTEKDLVFHAPVFASSFMPEGNKLRIMEGDTSNVALDPINNANSKALQAQASMGSFIMNQNMSA